MRVLVDGGNSGSGGYLRYLSGILGSGALDGVEVLLVCSPGIAAAVGPLDPQVTVRVEPQLDDPRRWTRLAWWRRSWPRVVAGFRPDIVWHPAGLMRGRSGTLPRVAVHHFMAPFASASYRLYGFSRFSLQLLLTRARLIRSFQRADGVVFLAEYTCRVVSTQARRVVRSTVVPNAVSAPFLAAPLRDAAALSSPVRLLCVSTLYLFKHQWHVVDAVTQLRAELGLDLRVEFVGGGEPRARTKLTRRIDDLGAGAYATLSEVPAASMPTVYRGADVFVFPSADEAWPITLGEAMASGLPIACSDRMAMPDILRDAGTYFDPEDPASIADALRALLTDPELRRRNGALARRYSQDYTWERSAASLVDFLHRVSRGAA
jgi:glycosyltransferase involved in cell wall biosynthesis